MKPECHSNLGLHLHLPISFSPTSSALMLEVPPRTANVFSRVNNQSHWLSLTFPLFCLSQPPGFPPLTPNGLVTLSWKTLFLSPLSLCSISSFSIVLSIPHFFSPFIIPLLNTQSTSRPLYCSIPPPPPLHYGFFALLNPHCGALTWNWVSRPI